MEGKYFQARRRRRSAPSIAQLGAAVAGAASGRLFRSMRNTGGYYEYKRGGAAPLPGRNPVAGRRRKQRARLQKKCAKMKGTALKKEVCLLSNKVKEMKHENDSSLAELTFRQFDKARYFTSVNLQASDTAVGITTGLMESALAQLKYFNPATNAFVTASGISGTDQKTFHFKNIVSTIHLRNNYQQDVELVVYLCTPRSDTSIAPHTAWSNGIADDVGNVTSIADYGSLPTDYETFKDLWVTKRVINKVLSPGESTKVSNAVDDIKYDPSFVDTHPFDYQKKYKSFSWLVILKGCPSHDTAANQVGVGQAGLDVIRKTTMKISYNAGQNFTYIYMVKNFDTPTNGFVQSQKPVADNIAYSQA